jgi:hypothetical protein
LKEEASLLLFYLKNCRGSKLSGMLHVYFAVAGRVYADPSLSEIISKNLPEHNPRSGR